MTPQQKLKYLILVRFKALTSHPVDFEIEDITEENVDLLYETYEDDDDLSDARQEVRCGGYETNIQPNWSRHYECESRADQLPDGSWVGWDYWFGGGKHGEPSAMPWIETAYDLECTGERTVIVREFAKK